MDPSHETDFNTENYPLPFYRFPSSLQVIASKKIAVLLWRHRIHNIDPDAGKIITDEWLRNQQFDICGPLRVPPVIGEAIKKSTREYRSRIENWIDDHAHDIFKECVDHDMILRCIDYIEHDDDKLIAKKLLQSDVLDAEEKYRLACKYCWKNYVERLWPSVSNNIHITGTEFHEAEVLYYWNCRMMGVTPEGLPGDTNRSIEFRMISHGEVTDWLAIEYFLDHLNAEERLSVIVDVLEQGCEQVLINILPKLNKMELNHVLEDISCHIFITLAEEIAYFDYVLQIWTYVCKLGSLHSMYDTLFAIWMKAFGTEKSTGHQVSVVLHELWIRAPVAFTEWVITRKLAMNFIERLCDIGWGWYDLSDVYGRDMSFLLKMIETEAIPIRNQIWRRNWHKLIVRAEPLYLEQFTKLCFDNEDEMIRFKESVMMNYDELEVEFEKFLEAGYCSELLNYVHFCSSNEPRVENLKRRIIALQFRLIRSNLETFRHADFDRLIFGTFSNIEFAKQFRAEYVLASENELLPVLFADLDEGCLEYAIKICNYLSYELCPTRVKREFLEHCRKYLIDCEITEFETSHWREFVTSCAGSEENVRVFKESFSVDEVFYKIFGEVVKTLRNELIRYDASAISKFILLDNFLFWYFDNVADVKDYKRNKLKDGRRSRVIEMVTGLKGGRFVDNVLRWIFDGDIELVEEFRMSNF